MLSLLAVPAKGPDVGVKPSTDTAEYNQVTPINVCGTIELPRQANPDPQNHERK